MLDKRPCEICGKPIAWAGGARNKHLNAHVKRGEAIRFTTENGHCVYVSKRVR